MLGIELILAALLLRLDAIGASRGRLMRQMLVESFLLAALGSAIGFASAWFLTRILTTALPAEAGLDPSYFAPDGLPAPEAAWMSCGRRTRSDSASSPACTSSEATPR